MKKRIVGELAAAMLVLCSLFIPNMLFSGYLAYLDVPEFAAAAEISLMVVNSVLAAGALYYLALRILNFTNQKE